MEEQPLVKFLSKALRWFGRLAWLIIRLVPMAPMKIITIATVYSTKKSDKLGCIDQ